MLTSILKSTVIMTVYNLDKDAFVTLFCENTDKPQMHCDGKCALSKVQDEQQETDVTKTLKKVQLEVINIVQLLDFELFLNISSTESNKQPLPSYDGLYYFELQNATFRPPIS